MSTLPVLLPNNALVRTSSIPHLEWKPTRYLSEPQPPPQDEGKVMEQELANQRQMIDGKLIKKTRPRRTVDYNGGMGRWILVRYRQFVVQVDPDCPKVAKASSKSILCSSHETSSPIHYRRECTSEAKLQAF